MSWRVVNYRSLRCHSYVHRHWYENLLYELNRYVEQAYHRHRRLDIHRRPTVSYSRLSRRRSVSSVVEEQLASVAWVGCVDSMACRRLTCLTEEVQQTTRAGTRDDSVDKHDVAEVDNRMDYEVCREATVYTFEDGMAWILAAGRPRYRWSPIDCDHQMCWMAGKDSSDSTSRRRSDFA